MCEPIPQQWIILDALIFVLQAEIGIDSKPELVKPADKVEH
jgi:hypothetical protein